MHGTADDKASDAPRRQLLLKLLERSPYRRALRPHGEPICDVALQNAKVRAALDAILADVDHQALGRVDAKRHALHLTTIRHLFEWIYFASDDFVERARRG